MNEQCDISGVLSVNWRMYCIISFVLLTSTCNKFLDMVLISGVARVFR